VRTRPLPFPPEPLRSAVIQLTRNRVAAADRRQGRRGLWLGALDRLGLGFDSSGDRGGISRQAWVRGGASRTGDVTAGGENRN
jgi:hypothetical protein